MNALKIILWAVLYNSSYLIVLDYWHAADFDENENCHDKSLLEQHKIDGLRCAQVNTGSIAVQFDECKRKLTYNLISSCPHTEVKVNSKILIDTILDNVKANS